MLNRIVQSKNRTFFMWQSANTIMLTMINHKIFDYHLTLAQRKWKEHWLMHGDSNCHPNCPPKVLPKMIQCWKSLDNIVESAQMKKNQSKVHNLSTCGWWALGQWIHLKVHSGFS